MVGPYSVVKSYPKTAFRKTIYGSGKIYKS
jgi:hypothetical protein